jgi:hypothetical protein
MEIAKLVGKLVLRKFDDLFFELLFGDGCGSAWSNL